MKARILSLAAALTATTLLAGAALAACYSVYWPQLTSNYTYTYPPGAWPGHDGWTYRQFGYVDNDRKADYAGHKLVIYFTTGATKVVNGPSWAENLPAGVKVSRLDLADVDSCGNVIAYRRQF